MRTPSSRLVPSVILVAGGLIGISTGFRAAAESIEVRLGLLMAIVGVPLLVSSLRFRAERVPGERSMSPYRCPPQEPRALPVQGAEDLLVACLLIAVGILGLMVGARTGTEVGLEALMTMAGILLFTAEARHSTLKKD